MNAIYLVLLPIACLYTFWLLFVLVMGFYRAHLDNRLTSTTKALAAPAIFIGYSFDLLSNWTIAWLVFAERPKRPLELVTDRLSRYINGPSCSNKTRAQWLCDELLDPFDPTGKHCK